MEGNEIRIYKPEELHFGKTDISQNMEWFQLSIPKSFFECPSYKRLSDFIYDRMPGKGNVFISKHQAKLTELMSEIFSAYKASDPFLNELCMSNILKALYILNKKENNISRRTNTNKIFSELVNIINENYSEITSLSDLCEITHFCPSYINRIFKENIGLSPYKFIIGKKLNAAKEALISGMNVSDACECAGFESYSNFITLFRKNFNITPRVFKTINSN